jgi:hypothetical protein
MAGDDLAPEGMPLEVIADDAPAAAEVLLVAVVEVEPQAARVRARAPPATSRSARFINICCSLGGRLRDSEPCRVSLWLMGDYSDPVRSDSLRCH